MDLSAYHPVLLGLAATMFTYLVTALGASLVFFFKTINRKILDSMLGFSAGVMIAASFWSLLNPAIELCGELGYNGFFIPAIGFFCGGGFIVLASKMLEKNSYLNVIGQGKEHVKRSILLVMAVTLHNIPEGLAVGVAFGSAAQGSGEYVGAVLLALGIGLQNFPEGAAVSLPLRREGVSRRKSFFFGQMSGIVEPIAGLIGVLAAITMNSILPFMLSFSAGAMIGVVASELLPEATAENKNLGTMGVVLGFIMMMVLDVALG